MKKMHFKDFLTYLVSLKINKAEITYLNFTNFKLNHRLRVGNTQHT